MPKLGMEPKRRAALVSAVIDEIGETRSLDVTVAQIARRAGMSSGLAHHYFGSKEQMLIAAMRHILSEFSAKVRAGLQDAEGPRARLEAILRANFAPHVFDPRKTSAWLSFYALAQSKSDASHLMQVYQRRLRSNLLFDLRKLSPDAERVADTLAALIDGVYLRAALTDGARSDAAFGTVSHALAVFLDQSQPG
ncbi:MULTISPECIES: choline-binding transcriptional repressor BetI [unclassified Epibacterium]|uniref:choline-binding transcriptional repressor BetI n=1 Tax=unclassified Epibacterium TaxID=2639179 RepID=UPI001EF70310|nr:MULTISPECIES: transcriptional regulator BetI [unclassified Epibacterium]MCG7626073.1 transcriptional regulator BetI [Epibacterium sp. Ofav1-8]MCG7630607.1 transcriptional regulator BetI [Epibacterium sp. MM17-32]